MQNSKTEKYLQGQMKRAIQMIKCARWGMWNPREHIIYRVVAATKFQAFAAR